MIPLHLQGNFQPYHMQLLLPLTPLARKAHNRVNFILCSPKANEKTTNNINDIHSQQIARRHSHSFTQPNNIRAFTSRNTNRTLKHENYCKDTNLMTQITQNRLPDRKAISKNLIKPCKKPVNIRPSLGEQIKIDRTDQIDQNIKRLEYQRPPLPLSEVKLSQSNEPVVQPYRDRSIDSYRYGQGFGYQSGSYQQSNCAYSGIKDFKGEYFNSYFKDQNSRQNTNNIISDRVYCGANHPFYNIDICPPNPLFQHLTPIQNKQQSRSVKIVLNPQNLITTQLVQNKPQLTECSEIRHYYQPYSLQQSSYRKKSSNQQISQPFSEADQDKWDKILRMRQQKIMISQDKQKNLGYNQENLKNYDETAYRTAMRSSIYQKLQDIQIQSVHSYQQSGQIRKSSGSQIDHPMTLIKTPKKYQSPNIQKDFSQKMKQITNKIQLNSIKKNDMKYSYSFDDPQQDLYRDEKEIFGRFLNCQNAEWMMLYKCMIEKMDENSQILNFVKIGEGQNPQRNILAHYIGIWLLEMGFDRPEIRDRIISNVQLYFSDPQQGNNEQIGMMVCQMYNKLLCEYLPADLQQKALLQTCRRGWQYFTILICKILQLLSKSNKKVYTKSAINESQFAELNWNEIFEKLKIIIESADTL